MTRDRWIAAHPYLAPLAAFQAAIEGALDVPAPAPARAPRWEAYDGEYALGVPLLRGVSAQVDLAPAGEVLGRLAERVAEAKLPDRLAASARGLRDHLRASPEARAQAVAWALDPGLPAPPEAGLARFLGWTAIAHALATTVEEFTRHRDEARWHRGLCPTCGALPAMGQLVEGEAGKHRLLACPCCRTRWSFRRIGCPFCGNDEAGRMDVLEVEGEERLRIDSCQDCKGYVKTVVGEGEEEVFLADWTTLHLDLVARERGLERKGASLYDL